MTPGHRVHSDGFRTYDGLVSYGYGRHYRVKHGENEFATGHNHINGMENFGGCAGCGSQGPEGCTSAHSTCT